MKTKYFKKIKKIQNRTRYVFLGLIIVIGALIFLFSSKSSTSFKTQSVNVKVVDSEIVASGSIDAQNEASLNFQTGGKVVYLPFSKGDYIYQGQTIAQLDTATLSEELQIAANNYEIAKNNTSQTLENQKAGVLEGQTRSSLDTSSKQSYSAVPETDVIYDTVKNIVDNANLTQSTAQLNVDLANYALGLATLVSPINGILLREDITTSGVNVTSATTFVIADPSSMVFSANVRQQDINFISVGNTATVSLDGQPQKFSGVINKIYPEPTTDSNNENVYRVDISVDNLPNVSFGQKGTAVIKSNFNKSVMLVPSWTILSNSRVWVLSNGKPVLKTVIAGSAFQGQTEILNGLSDKDKVITDPKMLITKLYSIL